MMVVTAIPQQSRRDGVVAVVALMPQAPMLASQVRQGMVARVLRLQ
jgi:hypothetical protein